MKFIKYALGALIALVNMCTYAENTQSSLKRFLTKNFNPATQSYQELNADPTNPFVLGIGTAMSQTGHTTNTVHPHFLALLLQKVSQKASDPAQWLKDHWGYVVQAIPDAECNTCHTKIRFQTLLADKHEKTIDKLTRIIAANKTASSIALTHCPLCKSSEMQQYPQQPIAFTDKNAQQMTAQVQKIGSFDQPAAKTLPPYRLSIEIADVLQDGTDQIDPVKLDKLAQRLKELHYPIVFFHHYANPQCKPNLFEHKEDIIWFANICGQIVRACPGLTHVCPISQIMGFGLQVSRGTLPPFETKIQLNEFLENIIQAQRAAGKAMKQVNPDIKVLACHQWKPMHPKHNSLLDPRHALEKMVCSIADYMYNQKFVNLFKNHMKEIDGIALSVYPALYFDMWKPTSDNCSGKIDPVAALEAIEKTAQAFPGKDIYITETGCNNFNQNIKKQFVDMILHACTIARKKGITVKSCYFWGHSNKSYMEWNKAPGATNFGAFESFDPNSINEYGQYLHDIVTQH